MIGSVALEWSYRHPLAQCSSPYSTEKMAVLKLVLLFSFALFILILLSDDAKAFPDGKTSARTNHKKKIKVKPIQANLGATCRLKCKIPSKTSEVLWFKDGLLLNITKSSGYQIKRRSKQKREFLKIIKISQNNCGLFECLVRKSGKHGAWRIVLSDGNGVKCKRTRRETDKTPVCGKAGKGKTCANSRFPNCKSFAGPPKDFNTAVFIHKGKPVIQIGWKPPDIGYNDLWGYQVHILGFAGHAGFQRCIQINSKEDKEPYHTFNYIKFGSEYRLILQSLPSKEMVEKKVYVKEKCEFKEFKMHTSCCFISDLNSTVDTDRGTISLFWSIHCADQSIDIKRFRVAWTNLQNPEKCSGLQTFRNDISEISRYNYSIILSEECQQHNYSIKVIGVHESNETTRKARIMVSYPQKIAKVSATTVWGNKSDDSTKVFVAVAGVIFGVALVALFFVYKYCFTKVVYKLPNPSQRIAVSSDHSPSRSGEPLLDEGIKRVFLMSARCCQQCKWVVHCLGELLTSTGLVEVRADLWSENEISSGVVRWYEEEIREAKCVVVLASSKMARWKKRTKELDAESDDLLDITAQLNLVSGEIIRDPNSPKFIPAYFKYNGEPKDIPDFLSSRLAYKLPNDLNRLIYHVLNIEAIQPYRTRPIVVLGGSDHPFESRKVDLLQAIAEADEEHLRIESEKNNRSSVA
ncbi:uncharacterized protein LOC116286875 [Actinia tenebrosa]|uniref:Uncharacterized protein LOC116286875 n=1 Tax=Actinia tenebrosa TaxID=6105 RepID=A0A6P8H1Q1_ACTTE|nr:uncharacterized protein LOC116286875 [Actinia tenebrosa]